MSHRILIAALAAFALPVLGAAVAHAQPGLSTKPNYDEIDKAGNVDEGAQRQINLLHNNAITALQMGNYQAAETVLSELLARSQPTLDANFLMGLAKIGMGSWSEARTYLEVAVQKEPKRPEPKTRLGVTLAKLNDIEGAKRQRAELVSLDAACHQSCPDAKWIADGLVQIDQAIAPATLAQQAALAAPAGAAPASAIAETKDFSPEKYSLVTFENSSDLYDLLTKPGRCEPKKLAEPRQPCALILYQPVGGAVEGGLSANFKPVFRIDSPTSVWAIHDKLLQKVKIEALYFDEEQIIGQKTQTYASVAVIGNAENQANCAAGKPCLNSLVAQDMFRMYSGMPDSVVVVIWGEGMKEPNAVRIR